MDGEINAEEMKVEKKNEPEKEEGVEVKEKPKQEETQENVEEKEDEVDEELEGKMPFPTACIVRIMKANMDKDKMIKKDVKIAMNKWLGTLCAKVAKEMNKLPYVMMHMHEFEEAKRKYEDLENFDKEKNRILAHFEAIKQDVDKLERDLGKEEDDEEIKFK